MENLLALIIGAVFVNNFILTRFLGLCPFFGVSKKTSSAIGMGFAVVFVMGISSAVTWFINYLILVPFKIEYLQIVSFILTIAFLVQVVEIILKRFNETLITTNCAILGVAFINVQNNYSFIAALVFGISAGIGFTLALILMSGIRERLELAKVPDIFKGLPIAFIVAAIMSMAFLAFSGMIK
jgi:electron transport complex protein RnfA